MVFMFEQIGDEQEDTTKDALCEVVGYLGRMYRVDRRVERTEPHIYRVGPDIPQGVPYEFQKAWIMVCNDINSIRKNIVVVEGGGCDD
jgi:hypothetical protein